MGQSKKNKVSPGQLTIPGLENTKNKLTYAAQSKSKKRSQSVKESTTGYQTNTTSREISICVGVTFDPCQGIREFRQKYDRDRIPSRVVFDCRHLELAEQYATSNSKEFFAPEETYLIGKGGLISNSVFLNFLRCYGTLANWSEEEYKKTGSRPIKKFKFIRPNPTTHVGRLWNVLGLETLASNRPQNIWTPDSDLKFQSRIVTPFLIVSGDNKTFIRRQAKSWLDYIYERIGDTTHNTLIKILGEVVTNLVDHGNKGTFGVSVWPSGQIEILWSNPIDHLADWWPPEDKKDPPRGLAKGLLDSEGVGIKYIYEKLLPKYKGVFIVSWRTYNLIFRSGKDCSITGLNPRSKDDLPRSILFHLHLFCSETRNKS